MTADERAELSNLQGRLKAFDADRPPPLPIAMGLAIRTGKNYVMYILVICSAGAMTHGLMVPHPGPIAMARILGIEVGSAMIGGVLIGLVPVTLSWFFIKRVNAKLPIEVRPTGGKTLEELTASMDKPESELPSFVAAIVPVLLPIIFMTVAIGGVLVLAQGSVIAPFIYTLF